MANLIVTYTRSRPATPRDYTPPVAVGSAARSEELEIDATSPEAVGSLAAQGAEDIVELHAVAACWVKIGSAPTAISGEGHYLAAGESRTYWVETGEKVAVIAAA